jgi:hypothetical protein
MGSFVIGNGRTLKATFKDSTGAVYTPPAVYFIIESPPDAQGAVTKTVIQSGQTPPTGWPAITNPSTGNYQLILNAGNLNRVGNWHWRVDDGNNVVATDADFQITPSSATH